MTAKERLDQHDRQIAAIRKLVEVGMKMLVENRQLTLDTRRDLRTMAALHKKSDEKLDRLIRALERGTNGHPKTKFDLQ